MSTDGPFYVSLGHPTDRATVLTERPSFAANDTSFPVIVQVPTRSLALEVTKMDLYIRQHCVGRDRQSFISQLTSYDARTITIDHTRWYPLLKGKGIIRSIIFTNHKEVTESIIETASDKAHPVVFRTTSCLSDALIFLLVCKDPLTGKANPKERQDHKFPLMTLDGLQEIQDGIRRAKISAQAEDDIPFPAGAARPSWLQAPPLSHSKSAPVSADESDNPDELTWPILNSYCNPTRGTSGGSFVAPPRTPSPSKPRQVENFPQRQDSPSPTKRAGGSSSRRDQTMGPLFLPPPSLSLSPSAGKQARESFMSSRRAESSSLSKPTASREVVNYIRRNLDSPLQLIYDSEPPPMLKHVCTGELALSFFYHCGYTECAVFEMLQVQSRVKSAEDFAQIMVSQGECFCFSEMVLAYKLMNFSP
ncbi:hypothetical protein BDN71DRAFT_1508300 [Pleurotus eryngii]|uniref:Uncharacterized protein n=1 Tax=Pleurotus eryngii TaxID=5323 RepID=A0A9P6DFK3_PLEER|nr:hypothetical protein BDN71DRAFT_1508300 [Pleurotus eryngii]